MNAVIIEGIRCFRSKQRTPLAPLTLLVGENSTGKSTFLASIRLAWDIMSGKPEPDFNEDPFHLGAYENIANYTPGKGGGRAKFFLLGCEFSNGKQGVPGEGPVTFSGTFSEDKGQPVLSQVQLASGPYSISVRRAKEGRGVNITLTSLRKTFQISEREFYPFGLVEYLRIAQYNILGRRHGGATGRISLNEAERKAFERLAARLYRDFSARPYAMAPVRTKPERTYDPKREMLRPEGGHIPMVLAQTLSARSDRTGALLNALSDFGHQCGLFEDVKVRRLGRKAGDPFQVKVKISGPAFNLVDVGYGVSQALPILVDSLTAHEGQILLLQQPEVHLHPRAQAQLGTFLAQLAKHKKNMFVVETHSDYLVDRVRMDVRDGVGLSHEEVLILYFQRKGSEVAIQPLHLDKQGNLCDAPPGYRQFFLEEDGRFLGV